MGLNYPTPPEPGPDASAADRMEYWHAVAEDDYASGRREAATAAAHIAAVWLARSDREPYAVHLDNQMGMPLVEELRAAVLDDQPASVEEADQVDDAMADAQAGDALATDAAAADQ